MDCKDVLRILEYSIGSATNKKAFVGNGSYRKITLPLAQVCVDFEDSKFSLECDMQFLIRYGSNQTHNLLRDCKRRAKVEMNIYPSFAIDLGFKAKRGLILLMNGTLQQGKERRDLEGELIIENIGKRSAQSTHAWQLSFWIIDKGKLMNLYYSIPVYFIEGSAELN